jgi:hypothetical protein
MDFRIVRLHADQEVGRRYHLFDGKGKLLLVADHANPWLPDDELNRVRFARSGGQVVGALDLPTGKGMVRNGRVHTSYALILDHAVYAILNKYQDEAGEQPPFFTIEADGMIWLAWREPDSESFVALYNEVPSNLMIVSDPLESNLLDPVGTVSQTVGATTFSVSLPINPFHHADIIMLALIFLLEQS